MVKLLIYNNIDEWEAMQQYFVDLFNIKCRYSGSYKKPDIILNDNYYAIPYPDKLEHQEKVNGLDWREFEINDVKKNDETLYI